MWTSWKHDKVQIFYWNKSTSNNQTLETDRTDVL